MALVRGPFDLKWGDNTLLNIEEVTVDYEQDSEDYTTLGHNTFEIDGPIKASATITLLASDVAALSVVLPQHHVLNGAVMSTGETVAEAYGAIDMVALDCDTDEVYNDLDIIACGSPGEVFRLVNARTKLESVEFDDKLRKVMVKFIGEPAQSEGVVQFFKEGTISVVS